MSMQPWTFWREGDIVVVGLAGQRNGVLDTEFSWPALQTYNPRWVDGKGMTWPVRIGQKFHMYFPVAEQTDGMHIIENKTLLIHVRRIQTCWKNYRRKLNRNAIIIQSAFRRCISDAYHPMCIARLLREHACMTTELKLLRASIR